MSLVLRYTSGDVQVLGSRSDRPQRLMGSAAMACVAFACSWTLAVNLAGPRAGAIDVSGTIFDAIEHTAPRGDKLVLAAPSPQRLAPAVSKSDAPLFDDRFTLGTAAQSFAASAPAQPRGWSVAAAPTRRPRTPGYCRPPNRPGSRIGVSLIEPSKLDRSRPFEPRLLGLCLLSRPPPSLPQHQSPTCR